MRINPNCAPGLQCAALIGALLLGTFAALPQERSAPAGDVASESMFYCPMDPDVRSKTAGKCSVCGMDLLPGIPDPIEYLVSLRTEPPGVRPGAEVELQFEIMNPDTGERAVDFKIVHEKIFHLLMVGQELDFFAHEHPELGDDGIFRLRTTFPRPGAYRLLTDFYPGGSTPQMIPLTVTTAGFEEGLPRASIEADLSPQAGSNVTVSLRTEPAEPLAGLKTLLFFELDTADELQPFLGAWAHLLTVSDDLVDLIHAHPTFADGGLNIQVNMIFPRPGMYRVWIQTQREGVVNTVAFNVPVQEVGLRRVTLPRK